jgi:hypothetical protein
MRDLKEIIADARDRMAFSNSDEGYGWMDANCFTCIHEKPSRQGHEEDGCPLILVALMNKTPAEWLDGPRDEHGRYGIADQYHCVEFRHEDDGPGPEPQPIPDPPGQDCLLPRDGYTGPLMFSAHVPKMADH